MIYFTSDLHFYHENIMKHCNRNFRNIEAMNQALINNWNNTVSAKDEVYILGDFTLKGPIYATEILQQLKGKKYFITGNHDRFVAAETFQKGVFEWVKPYHELKYHNQVLILCHYPFLEWDGFYRGSIHLHGHQHNDIDYNLDNLEKGIRRYDVGVDANNMTPVSIDQIIDFFSELPL